MSPDSGSFKPIRWGLLSTARINTRLIEAIRLSPGSVLSAVASREGQKARDYAAKWDIPHAFGGYQEMLDSAEVDVIYNSLPNSLHAEWTIKALRAGKHVLCEKPFATTLAETDQMIQAARETGKILSEAFMYLHHPQAQSVLEYVRTGRLGQLRTMQSAFQFMLADLSDPRAIPELGGGSIWDVGVYPISFFHALMGRSPARVFGWQHVGATGVDMTFAGQLFFPGDVVAQFTCSFETAFTVGLSAIGDKGTLTIARPFTGMEANGVFYDGEGGKREVVPAAEKHLYLGEVEDMERAINGGKAYLSLERTRSHIATAEALLRSAASGAVVECDWEWIKD